MSRKVLLSVLVLAVLIVSCKKVDIAENEKAMLVRADDFSVYGLEPANVSELEKYEKEIYFDGSLDFSYDFTSGEGDPELLVVSNTVSREKDSPNAMVTYESQKIGTRIGGASIEFKNLDHLYSYGDDSQFALMINKDGYPVGNFFTFRKGNIVYFLMFVGIYFDQGDVWEEFISDKIDRLAPLL